MGETLATKLVGSSLKSNLLQAVAAEDLDNIPLDLDDSSRFVISAVRAVARRSGLQGFTIFVYSEAPLNEGRPHGFNRIMHMQDNEGNVAGTTILTSRDANNGASLAHSSADLAQIVEQLISFHFDTSTTVIWNATVRTATVYPFGVADDQTSVRFVVPVSGNDLTQDEVCEVLDAAYNDNLKNPSGHTVKLWTKGNLVATAEEEIERHLKGQISMFFAGRARPIRVLIPGAAASDSWGIPKRAGF